MGPTFPRALLFALFILCAILLSVSEYALSGLEISLVVETPIHRDHVSSVIPPKREVLRADVCAMGDMLVRSKIMLPVDKGIDRLVQAPRPFCLIPVVHRESNLNWAVFAATSKGA